MQVKRFEAPRPARVLGAQPKSSSRVGGPGRSRSGLQGKAKARPHRRNVDVAEQDELRDEENSSRQLGLSWQQRGPRISETIVCLCFGVAREDDQMVHTGTVAARGNKSTKKHGKVIGNTFTARRMLLGLKDGAKEFLVGLLVVRLRHLALPLCCTPPRKTPI